ncbi:L-rhamnose mutarotase [Prevotella sp. oral taxon 376]|uniref:L-rhamnose mutarotase n=1 Tax=Prevotella sp. oral taxon 376 TaxID=712466 RepID=UPI000D1F1BEE|nr:L-rhamnose mutarotase [Prevotella sp. oral taxon 376]PTL32782.1 L-rhamnose mutarotase [Prevotella sp. oral taxon 376]
MQGYKVKEFGQPVKRYVQILSLMDEPELIRQYRYAHSKEGFWPEIKEGIRTVGILEMELYIYGNTEVMIVETPLDFDWNTAMGKLAGLPRQQEWEDFVGRFQVCPEGSTSDEKWHKMDRMFYLYED